MQKGPGRFELVLNLREVVLLFFVMVALFTGLLFFGYGVGYRQSAKAIQGQSTPITPMQERPQVQRQDPAANVEPEIRLENSPAVPNDPSIGPAEPLRAEPSGGKPLARQGKALPQGACRTDSQLSSLRKSLRENHPFAERLDEWLGTAWLDDATRSRQQGAGEPEAAIASSALSPEARDRVSAEVECGPIHLRAEHSVAC
jgi:hypothetical protein